MHFDNFTTPCAKGNLSCGGNEEGVQHCTAVRGVASLCFICGTKMRGLCCRKGTCVGVAFGGRGVAEFSADPKLLTGVISKSVSYMTHNQYSPTLYLSLRVTVLRLFRAFRVFRLFKRVPSLRKIVEGVHPTSSIIYHLSPSSSSCCEHREAP